MILNPFASNWPTITDRMFSVSLCGIGMKTLLYPPRSSLSPCRCSGLHEHRMELINMRDAMVQSREVALQLCNLLEVDLEQLGLVI